ncbi:GntR family transcriptional regulator [Roseiconus nitratireducens]|uniref:GntR family transcriptional regulator n=1 Tax=Roseiconus nitratireducens TaxID=2605748 RepID=A0A5M6D7U0_9BACT|nr:GntR family transcriptional regulator [Roseiconus nitratireducens]KAA5543591.1 GntR family transcriptional regulator [Roseiconus nitratireducens]
MTVQPSQFEIHPSSGIPIYRQIIDQVQALIVGGHLHDGQMLPSVRAMATELGVNPMTISKAYARLEADGVVERVRGKGMRILRPAVDGSAAQRLKQLYPSVESAIVRGRQLGLSDKQILDLIRKVLRENPL